MEKAHVVLVDDAFRYPGGDRWKEDLPSALQAREFMVTKESSWKRGFSKGRESTVRPVVFLLDLGVSFPEDHAWKESGDYYRWTDCDETAYDNAGLPLDYKFAFRFMCAFLRDSELRRFATVVVFSDNWTGGGWRLTEQIWKLLGLNPTHYLHANKSDRDSAAQVEKVQEAVRQMQPGPTALTSVQWAQVRDPLMLAQVYRPTPLAEAADSAQHFLKQHHWVRPLDSYTEDDWTAVTNGWNRHLPEAVRQLLEGIGYWQRHWPGAVGEDGYSHLRPPARSLLGYGQTRHVEHDFSKSIDCFLAKGGYGLRGFAVETRGLDGNGLTHDYLWCPTPSLFDAIHILADGTCTDGSALSMTVQLSELNCPPGLVCRIVEESGERDVQAKYLTFQQGFYEKFTGGSSSMNQLRLVLERLGCSWFFYSGKDRAGNSGRYLVVSRDCQGRLMAKLFEGSMPSNAPVRLGTSPQLAWFIPARIVDLPYQSGHGSQLDRWTIEREASTPALTDVAAAVGCELLQDN